MSIKKLLSTITLFFGFTGFWYFYDKGFTGALFPIAHPVYIFLLAGFSTKMVSFALFCYSVLLVYALSKLKGRKALVFALIGALIIVHLLCFRFTVAAFERLGAGITKQMLEESKCTTSATSGQMALFFSL